MAKGKAGSGIAKEDRSVLAVTMSKTDRQVIKGAQLAISTSVGSIVSEAAIGRAALKYALAHQTDEEFVNLLAAEVAAD